MDEELADGETARFWRHPGVPGVSLLNARFITYRYARHTHAEYAIGVIEAGVEAFEVGRRSDRAGAGAVVAVEPETVHNGYAGAPEGWAYRMTYPSVELLTGVAAELGLPGGAPGFPRQVLDDPAAAALLRSASRAALGGDALVASTRLRRAYARLLTHHARPAPPRAAAPAAVRTARELLHARLVDPPTLEELAARADSSPFALLRAFRRATGLPPHAYLTQLRVQQARRLLELGVPPAETAARTGFADQAHLTRHFKRAIGVPPGAYLRASPTSPASPHSLPSRLDQADRP